MNAHAVVVTRGTMPDAAALDLARSMHGLTGPLRSTVLTNATVADKELPAHLVARRVHAQGCGCEARSKVA